MALSCLTNAVIIHEGILGFCFYHRQLHGRVHGSSKIRSSVDNNLLPKIRFRQKSVTFSAVDVNRKCWPKRRLHYQYGNTSRGIRKMASKTIYLLNSNCGDATISKTVLQHAAAVNLFMKEVVKAGYCTDSNPYICILWSFWELILTRMAESLFIDNSRQ